MWNRQLWHSWSIEDYRGYTTDQDAELQRVFNFAVDRGINLFDTADSYGWSSSNSSVQLFQNFSFQGLLHTLLLQKKPPDLQSSWCPTMQAGLQVLALVRLREVFWSLYWKRSEHFASETGYNNCSGPDKGMMMHLVFIARTMPASRTLVNAGTGLLNGRSEQLLGQFARAYPGSPETREDIRIATKLAPYPWRVTAGQFVAAGRWACLELTQVSVVHDCVCILLGSNLVSSMQGLSTTSVWASSVRIWSFQLRSQSSSHAILDFRGSLRRLGTSQLAIGQLHWSTANYQPLQERALWDGLVRLYDEVSKSQPHGN